MYLNLFNLIIFFVILGAQIVRSFLPENQPMADFLSKYKFFIIKFIFIFSIFVVFSLLFYQSYLQYQIWFSNDLAKHFLNQSVEINSLNISINYFIFYVVTRFFVPYLISLIAALIFLILAVKLNKKYDERFFESEEPWFGALAFFLIGHPGWLFYFFFLIFIYLSIHLSLLLIARYSLKETRISLWYWWFPTAIFVILISKWLSNLPLWKLMIF